MVMAVRPGHYLGAMRLLRRIDDQSGPTSRRGNVEFTVTLTHQEYVATRPGERQARHLDHDLSTSRLTRVAAG
jgi:hypothetical protein